MNRLVNRPSALAHDVETNVVEVMNIVANNVTVLTTPGNIDKTKTYAVGDLRIVLVRCPKCETEWLPTIVIVGGGPCVDCPTCYRGFFANYDYVNFSHEMRRLHLIYTPMVGMGVTWGAGSDCYPGTIASVTPSFRQFQFRNDNHKLISGSEVDGSAAYEYSRDPDGTLHKANYSPKRAGYVYEGQSIGLGHRRYYRDPHV